MGPSVYTLLIVESPTIAGIVQKLCPPSVYVISTEGFCWRPKFDAKQNKIKAIADPDKLSIRKELKEQSKIANTIVVAVDADASGDFIAWSVNRYIESSNIKRARLQNLSKQSIYSMLGETFELDESQLETRLKNHFLIQHLWSEHAKISDIQMAGLISVFGADNSFQSFLNENEQLYKSTRPIQSPFDEWISVRSVQNNDHYQIVKPLSTFDVLGKILKEDLAKSGNDAQLLLNRLFQTVLPFSEESLISYPRTSAQAFYSDTWQFMHRQYMKIGPLNELKPTYLQEIADNESPHESIHPINLSLKPASISGELPKKIGALYALIYDHTVKSLSMPNPLQSCLISDLNPDVAFYPDSPEAPAKAESVHPCLTLSELGIKLEALGVVKASSFGKTVDQWIASKWIHLDDQVVRPGAEILKYLGDANSLRKKLIRLNLLKEESTLKHETVRDVITS